MAASARWGRAGWGRTPASLRRHQVSPSFMHPHEVERDVEVIGGRFGPADTQDFIKTAERKGEMLAFDCSDERQIGFVGAVKAFIGLGE